MLVVNQLAERTEELRLARKQLDDLLVAMTFLVFAFDGTTLRAATKALERGLAKKVRLARKRFIDQVPLGDYLAVLNHEFRKNETAVGPLGRFFDELIKSAAVDQSVSLAQRTAGIKRCIEGLIEEAGRRIEKPDRIFYSAESLDSISEYAESLFDVEAEKEKFSKKYKWAYPRGRSFTSLNNFWAVCMIGLFALGQALDRYVASAQASEKDTAEVTSSANEIVEDEKPSATVSLQKDPTTTEGSVSPHSRCIERGRYWIAICLAAAQRDCSSVGWMVATTIVRRCIKRQRVWQL
jgi:hypothetical protein